MNKHSYKSCIILFFVVLFLMIPELAMCGTLVQDTVWRGEIDLQEDLLVPAGVTLTIMPGTIVRVTTAESTKTDPEYLSPLTEISVRGRLKVEGGAKEPVQFLSAGDKKAGMWAGIVVDGGRADIRFSRIMHAESALYVIDGNVRLADSELSENRNGIFSQGAKSEVEMVTTTIIRNEYGIFTTNNAKVKCNDCTVRENRKRDKYAGNMQEYADEISFQEKGVREVSRIYGDEVLLGDTVWQGRIELRGIIRVPEKSRLVILPGTIVEFRKKDTNSDGIGENGLMIQGVIIAKGTPAAPIMFRSAEKNRAMGDWDAINIMNSDGTQNLIEFCQIEDAYRALHFHFSNVAVTNTVLRNNYRAVQFQESLLELRNSWLYSNKSGIQGRDSEVNLSGNIVSNNFMGGNFFRCNINAVRNRFLNNIKEGLRLREGVPVVSENIIAGSRYGLMVADTYYGSFGRNLLANNSEIGFSLKNVDNVEISGNFIAGNGINGMNVQDSSAVIKENQFAGNGERGMGIISFDGLISANNFSRNGLYAIDLEGKNDILAPSNWWGGGEPERVVFDKLDEPGRGKVKAESPMQKPLPFIWAWDELPIAVSWDGEIVIKNRVKVVKGVVLTVMPGTRVAFAEGAGMLIHGKLVAKGDVSRNIIFTSLEKLEAGAWDEVQLEYANSSIIDHAIVEYGSWGVHSHFTNLILSNCTFRNNYGGMRFRSGPVTVTGSKFTDNTIGIRSYRGNGVISGNEITRNETGIFVREKGGGLTISGNNLAGNSSYGIRVGDFNDEDVDAKGNWWGDGNPADRVFDGRTEPGIGMVIFTPFLDRPISTDQGGRK
jgi:hypothetical protein